MKYSEKILEHFFYPQNVGIFNAEEKGVGRSVVGNYENGALIHFQIKVSHETIIAAKFKAYGSCPIIAACSYVTEWVMNKSLKEAQLLTSAEIIKVLAIPELKYHAALLVEDALKAAIAGYYADSVVDPGS